MNLRKTAPPASAKDRLIVALDVPDVRTARSLADLLEDDVGVFKIGMELAYVGGVDLARDLAARGAAVFLDLKLHDISNTVERATAQIAEIGVRFLTVHAYPQTMAAAVAGAKGSSLALLGVTALTSYSDADLEQAGYAMGAAQLVERRARQACELGLPGLILSAQEAARVRALVGADMLLVTPGIRPAGAEAGDQKRVATPGSAIRDGADYLVVGRPILQAAEPKAAARAIVSEIEAALVR